jgi:hypothetical protein
MTFIPLQLFQSNLTGFLSNTSTTMQLPAAAVAQIVAQLPGGDFTIFALSNGVVSELVQCTGASGTTATIVRAQEGSIAQTFAAGTQVRFVWTTVGIQAEASGGSGGITLTGTGAAVATGGPYAFNVAVPATALVAGTGIAVSGAFPTFTVTNTAPETGGGGTVSVVTGSGTAVSSPITGGFNIAVPAGALTAGSGISVTGAWPNYTIINTQTPGGVGTVTSVSAGTGITITGSPTVTPVVALTPTGITAGTYGGLTVNTYGQLSAIAAGLLTSVASTTPALVVSTPSIGTASLAILYATTSVAGITVLAPATSVGSNNPADSLSSVTPAGVNAVISSLPPSTTSVSGIVKLAPATVAGSDNPADALSAVTPAGIAAVMGVRLPIAASGLNKVLSSASYTTLVGTAASSLTLVSGETAVFDAYVEVLDPGSPTAIPVYAIGVFNGATLLDGVGNISSQTRSLKTQIAGPFTGTLSLKITTLSGTNAVQSFYMSTVSN